LNPKNLSGVVAILIALLLITASAGAYLYFQLGQQTQAKNQYVGELTAANGRYDELASNYNSSLSLSNQTIAWLAKALAALNTSSPVYASGSPELSQLWASYLKLKPASSSLYAANVLIDFGNGTRHWYNDTKTQPGWNIYTETVVLSNGNIQATWYPQYQEHFVSGIGGVSNTKTNFWFLWTYTRTASWSVAQVGADSLPVYNGSIFAWTFCGADKSFAPTCKP